MSGEWFVTTLGSVIDLKRGYDLPKQDRSPGEIPVVSSAGVTDHHSTAMVKGPGVVTGRYGTLGKVFYIEKDFWPLNTTLYVHDFKGNDPRFISYLLRGLDFSTYSDKAAVPGLNRNDLHQSLVRVPSDPAEQRAIAYILGTLDDKIYLNRRMNETSEAIARALFKSWFVDFDPILAKAHRRDAGFPDSLAELFPEALEASEGREIPAGWKVVHIADLATIVGGSTPSTKETAFWDGGSHHWATPRDLSTLQEPVLLDTEHKVTALGLGQIGSGMLPIGTVLLSSRAPIGYLAIAEIPVAINQGFIAMKPREGVSNLFLLLWAEWAHEQILSRANGSTFLEISKASFRPIPVVCPPFPIFEAFERIVRPFYERVVSNARESRTVRALRDTLAPKLVSGELPVQDAERFISRNA